MDRVDWTASRLQRRVNEAHASEDACAPVYNPSANGGGTELVARTSYCRLLTASCLFLLRNCCASFSHRFSVRYLYAGAVLTASMHACIELVASWLSPNPACARPIKYSPCGSLVRRSRNFSSASRASPYCPAAM